jgi:hypothetical protein
MWGRTDSDPVEEDSAASRFSVEGALGVTGVESPEISVGMGKVHDSNTSRDNENADG